MERGDIFSPDPLNQNMEKVEAQLDAVRAEAGASISAEAQARAAGDSALSQRVTALEIKQYIFGSFTGTGQNPQFVDLGFTPAAVVLCNGAKYAHGMLAKNYGMMSNSTICAKIVDGGIQLNSVGNIDGSTPFLNAKGAVTYFLAFVE